jgi:hypothetical protein
LIAIVVVHAGLDNDVMDPAGRPAGEDRRDRPTSGGEIARSVSAPHCLALPIDRLVTTPQQQSPAIAPLHSTRGDGNGPRVLSSGRRTDPCFGTAHEPAAMAAASVPGRLLVQQP